MAKFAERSFRKLFGSQGLERTEAKIRCERKVESEHNELSHSTEVSG